MMSLFQLSRGQNPTKKSKRGFGSTKKGLICGTEIFKTRIVPRVERRWGGYGERSHGADSSVLAALCVSYLLKTCKRILSCTEYFVREKEAYNATTTSLDGCLVGEGQRW